MIERRRFIEMLTTLGYSYKRETKRTSMYRKIGGTHRIFVPKRDLIDEKYVKSSLLQAGCSAEEIESFLMGEMWRLGE